MRVVELRLQCRFPGPWSGLPSVACDQLQCYEYLLCPGTISLQMVMDVLWLLSLQLNRPISFPLETFLCSLHVVTWEGSTYLCQSLAK